MNVIGLFILFITIVWIGLFIFERRTLWIGAMSLIWLGIFIPYMIVSIEFVNRGLAYVIAIILVGIPVISFPFYLISFISLLIMSGVRLIKREGRRFKNFLSVAFGVFLVMWLILSPIFIINVEHPVSFFIISCISVSVYYFFGMMLLFAISSILNRIPIPFKKYDYIIVLGSGLIGDQVPPLLASRINKGIECFNRYHTAKRPVKVIFTGGQGSDEKLPEGVAMAKYAMEQGLAEEHIIIEDEAINTYENILYSKRLIDADRQQNERGKFFNILTVTNNFHVFRALLWAKKVGVKSDGIGSKTKFYFWLNALIREFIGVMYMQKKPQMIVLSILYAIVLFITLVTHYFV